VIRATDDPSKNEHYDVRAESLSEKLVPIFRSDALDEVVLCEIERCDVNNDSDIGSIIRVRIYYVYLSRNKTTETSGQPSDRSQGNSNPS
jgi:hypothetical protein